MKKHFRVTFRRTQCRDVFVEANDDKEAVASAREEDWNDDDWCDGNTHEDGLRDMDVIEVNEDGDEL